MARVSINDVAEYAGVSPTTVSHVLNETRFVREETRRKVLDAVEALDYQPSAIARGLATKSTQTIGLVISDITNPFWPAVTLGIEHEISRSGYHAIFCNTDEDASREEEYLRLLAARQIDGLLIAPSGTRSKRLLKMAQSGLPMVLIDRDSPDLQAPMVCVANEEGAYRATKHLIEMGHKRIGVLMGTPSISTQVLRTAGYKRALREAGLPLDETLIVRADLRFYTNLPQRPFSRPTNARQEGQGIPSASESVRQLLALPTPPTALFVTNNQMILGALQAIRNNDLTIPDDISFISFDDHDWAPFHAPPLTVIRQPTYQLGQIAARKLIALIRGEEVADRDVLPVQLIIRKSVKNCAEKQQVDAVASIPALQQTRGGVHR